MALLLLVRYNKGVEMQTNTAYQNMAIQSFQSTSSSTTQEKFSMDYDYLKNRVDTLLNPLSGGYTSESAKESLGDFWRNFENIYGAGTKDSSEQSDADVTKFLNDLRTKGAAKFLADLNQEKIDKMVEEYKQKLLDKMGNSPEAMQEIEKMVADYKKQLLEELQNSLDNDDKKGVSITPDALIQSLLLDSKQGKEKSPLQELLFAT